MVKLFQVCHMILVEKATGNCKDCKVLRLIDIWGDDLVQSQLEGYKRNKQIYDSISKELLVYGVHRSAEQCCENSSQSIEMLRMATR